MVKEIKKLVIEAAYKAKHGHIPSALSIFEIIVAIDKVLGDDDKIVLSKGHGCLAYYSYLACKGLISKDEVKNFGKKGSKLGGHPDRNKLKEIYASTGSLGHGLPIALGASLARKIKQKPGVFYCIVGDGECNEGSIWESLQIAVNNNLNNLVCVIDNNNSQIRSLPTSNLHQKLKAFGLEVIEVDGHNIDELTEALNQKGDKPLAIVANTIKGKGIKEMEDNMFAWHHRAPTDEEYKSFIEELI